MRNSRIWKPLLLAIALLGLLFAGSLCAVPLVVDKLTNGGSCKKSGSIQQRVFNPEAPARTVVALVVRDDICKCGMSGPNQGCHLRVDVGVEAGYFETGSPSNYWMEVYRSCEACEATITWLNVTQFKVVDDQGGEAIIDITQLRPRY